MISEDTQTVLVANEKLHLLAEKAIYWKSKKILLLGDLHLGKVSHFRKNGIPLSENAQYETLAVLKQLIDSLEIKTVIFLGDLFHSSTNSEWNSFEKFVLSYPEIHFELIVGNHDIIKKEDFEKINIALFEEKVTSPFLLNHEPKESSDYYVLSGHIHPGVKLNGQGRQKLLLPCFYFGKKQGILPAFGSLTGLAQIKVNKGDQIFIIANEEVISV